MKKRVRKFVFVLSPALVALFLTLYYRPWLSAQETAFWAHGINVPSEARDLQTSGNWRRGFLDRGAWTTFTIDAKDLPSFVNSLPVSEGTITCVPGEGTFKDGKALFTSDGDSHRQQYSCLSRVGDFMHVTVVQRPDGLVAVRIYTDWN